MEDRLLDKYVIVAYCDKRRKKTKYLTDHNLCDRNWSYNVSMAKIYYDISAAQIKAENLKYDHNPVDAQVMYITKDGKLVDVRRNGGNGRSR